MTNAARDFTDEELSRIDSVYEETLKYCRFLADDPDLEYDISVIGPIAEAAVEIMKEHGISAWFPYEDENLIIHTHY